MRNARWSWTWTEGMSSGFGWKGCIFDATTSGEGGRMERGVGMFKYRQEGVRWGLIDAENDLLEGPGSVP